MPYIGPARHSAETEARIYRAAQRAHASQHAGLGGEVCQFCLARAREWAQYFMVESLVIYNQNLSARNEELRRMYNDATGERIG